jgi:ABC-type oligopeptide transport system substrate-binding subunit
VLAGTGGVLFMSGEAGIGKSRLLAELHAAGADEAAERPALWLEGRCVSYGESMPYWPFRDLLREWLGAGTDDPELRVRVALRRAVSALVGDRELELYPYLGALLGLSLEPDAAARLAELSPEALQYRTFEVVEELIRLLAQDRPVVVALEDLHWADATSLTLVERLLALADDSGVLLVLTHRSDRDHPAWRVRELAGREYPHRTRELQLEALGGQAERELLAALVGEGTLPPELEARVLADAEGNPFYLEELVRSLADGGALVRSDGGWRFDHAVEVEIPPSVEKVILARIDRLDAGSRDVLAAASVLGRHFGLPLLEGVTASDGQLSDTLHELQRLDLLRQSRRWPSPEFRFKHALIQEAAYRTLLSDAREELHRRAAEWLEARHGSSDEEVLGLLAHHWLAAADEDKAVQYLARAGDKARQEYALDEAIGHYRELLPLLERRGERQAIALVLFKLALALHTSLRFGEANETYQRAFEHWTRPEPYPGTVGATLRVVSTTPPNDPDPKSAIAWPNIQLCMQLFDRLVEAWPERTLVPSLAERWKISDDGLRYVFYLREGLVWSDGRPLTAADVEFGIKRVLDPVSPGSSVAIYFVLENGQDYYLGRNRDADRIGVKALDDRTLEFRLVAPAPYFMSVMNRPDSGPQPRHAIEQHGESWIEPGKQVVSGPFRQVERTAQATVLERQERYPGVRPGNVARLEFLNVDAPSAIPAFARDEVDMIAVRYTPRVADLMPASEDAQFGEATWTGYIKFDHSHPLVSNVDFRRALAQAVDRDALANVVSSNLLVATGGIVPPAIQGHTPDIAPRFDPDAAREHLARSGLAGPLTIGVFGEWSEIAGAIAGSWKDVLGLEVDLLPWSKDDALGLRFDWKAPIYVHGWLPGYPDPEYYLRLLLHSDSKTNEGGFSYAPYDALIERARQERVGRARLELYHEADRMAVGDQIALIPLVYGRNMAFVKPWIEGWWEFGKSSATCADLVVGADSPRR